MLFNFSRKNIIFLSLLSSIVIVLIVVYSATASVNLNQECFSTEVDTKNSTLELVHILFRHGARTPVTTYPNDPYINGSFYPYGWGQLTNDGKMDLFKIGKWFAKRYQNLIKPMYSPDLLHAQSTASSRTLMSMSLVLAGMFPPKNTPMDWNSKLNWQPIPIFSEPLEKDVMLRMTAQCPAWDYLRKQAELENPPNPENLYRDLTVLTGQNVTTAEDVFSIYITLLTEQLYGLELPDWTHHYYPHKMRYMTEQNYINNAYNTEMQRIKAGPFLKHILETVKSKANGTLKPENRKLFLYCGHDWTIANILLGLNVWERQLPNFSSQVLFEWHQDPETTEYYLQLYFKNGFAKPLQPLTIPGCEFKCPLSKVLQLTKDVMPTGSYEEMCQAN